MDVLFSSGQAGAQYGHSASYTWRIVIDPSAISGQATQVRLRIFLRSTLTVTLRGTIGLQADSGNAFDMDPGAMATLTKGGEATMLFSPGDLYTDVVPFSVQSGRAVVVALYRVSGSAGYNNSSRPAGTTTLRFSGEQTGAVASSGTDLLATWYMLALVEGEIAMDQVQATLDQGWGVYEAHLAGELGQGWHLTEAVDRAVLHQPYGLRMGADLVQPYGDAPIRTSTLFQPYGDAGQLQRALVQRWQDAIPLAGELEQRWHLPAGIIAELNQPWAILGELAFGLLVQDWDIRDVEAVRAILQQSWSLADDGELLQYSLDVYCEGLEVGVSLCNIEASREEDSLSCEIHLARERDYLACAVGAELTVSVGIGATVEEYVFRVTSPRIEERHGEALYIIEALSPAAYLLGAPWAAGIDMELSGTAASIAATLAGDVTIDWQTVDWHIPAATWIAAGETPLDLLRRLADAVGAVVQSLPDGSLLVEPDYRYAVPGWNQSAADGVLVETLDCFSSGDSHDPRPGYNRYLVGDQMTAADGLRLEEEALSATLKMVRGYQIPWDGAFALTHTGGDWVQIETMGIEERQETEIIELVGGAGRTRYPIYSRDAVTWMQTSLGSVTVSEDGAVQADIEGQSLLELTYTTRCRRWRVRNPRNEQLQLVAEV